MGHRFRGNMYLFLGHLALKSEASDDDRCAKHSRSLMAWMTITPKLRIIILTIIYFPCSTSPCSGKQADPQQPSRRRTKEAMHKRSGLVQLNVRIAMFISDPRRLTPKGSDWPHPTPHTS